MLQVYEPSPRGVLEAWHSTCRTPTASKASTVRRVVISRVANCWPSHSGFVAVCAGMWCCKVLESFEKRAAVRRHHERSGAYRGVLRRQVYSCTPFAQCGGHGDRLNGIITTFLLAAPPQTATTVAQSSFSNCGSPPEVQTGRAFFIDSESPLPLQLLLQPRSIDWRAHASRI